MSDRSAMILSPVEGHMFLVIKGWGDTKTEAFQHCETIPAGSLKQAKRIRDAWIATGALA